MRIFEKVSAFKKNKKRPLVLALGNFDGIHQGHRKLLDYVIDQAKTLKGEPAIFSFQDHPQHILHPSHAPESLQSRSQKMKYLKSLGIKVCLLQKFDKKFSKLSAKEFVEKVLVKQLGIREICLGYNARFGQGRQGDADLLRSMGERLGFKVFQADPVVWKGSPVSSTAIREAIRHGKVNRANGLLGRTWSFEGRVIRGDGRGRKLGFATANLEIGSFVCPAYGVYAVYVRVGAQRKLHQAVMNIGIRPSFKTNGGVCVEVHLLKDKHKLYGKKLEVFVVKHLRNEKKFGRPELLVKQIRKDISASKQHLKKAKGS